MRDLSLHLLDIVENSVRAQASLVSIEIRMDTKADRLDFRVEDDGFGMDEALLARVTSPFATTRTERDVGLGIPMLMANAQQSGGDVSLESTPGQGTKLNAHFGLSNIDRPPLGDLAGTLVTLIAATPQKPDYLFHFAYDDQDFLFDTRQVKEVLGPEVPLNTPEVLDWIAQSLTSGIDEILPQSVETMEGLHS